MRIVWSNEARDDLEKIWTYLSLNASIERADDKTIKIVQACRGLSEWPRSGRARDNLLPGLRSIVSQPYLIFYRTDAGAVQIVRILDGRRDVETVLNEKP